jgi:hypothetical protein
VKNHFVMAENVKKTDWAFVVIRVFVIAVIAGLVYVAVSML